MKFYLKRLKPRRQHQRWGFFLPNSQEILPLHLTDYVLQADGGSKKLMVLEILPLKDATEELERQILRMALARLHNTRRMADVLEVNQSTIVRKLHQYGIHEI